MGETNCGEVGTTQRAAARARRETGHTDGGTRTKSARPLTLADTGYSRMARHPSTSSRRVASTAHEVQQLAARAHLGMVVGVAVYFSLQVLYKLHAHEHSRWTGHRVFHELQGGVSRFAAAVEMR